MKEASIKSRALKFVLLIGVMSFFAGCRTRSHPAVRRSKPEAYAMTNVVQAHDNAR
jgi:hypothetical protein